MLSIANLAGAAFATPLVGWTLGWQEIVVIVIVVLILFGGRKIPELAKGLGKGLREFKKEMRGVKQDFEAAAETDDDETYEPPRRKKRRPRPADEVAEPADDEPAASPADEPAHADEPTDAKG